MISDSRKVVSFRNFINLGGMLVSSLISAFICFTDVVTVILAGISSYFLMAIHKHSSYMQ